MTCRDKLENYFHEQQIPYQMQQHPIAFTAQDVAASEHLPGKRVAKVVLVFADGKPFMAVLPAPYRVDFTRLSQVLGAKVVRLADEEELNAMFPDCEVGAMPPFGNLYRLPVLVDQSLVEDETIVFSAGTHTETARMTYSDFARLVNPIAAQFARPPQEVIH